MKNWARIRSLMIGVFLISIQAATTMSWAASFADLEPNLALRKPTLVVPVIFPNDLTPEFAADELHTTMEFVSRFYVSNSFNTQTMSTIVTPPIMAPRDWDYYRDIPPKDPLINPGYLMGDITRELSNQGYNPALYTVQLVHRRIWNWGGLGGPGGTWYQANGVDLFAHELGHVFGLPHANWWRTQNRGVIGARPSLGGYSYGSPEVIEYGNLYDVMGSGTGSANLVPHFSIVNKMQLGYVGPSQVVNIPAGNGEPAEHRFRLYAMDSDRTLPNRYYGAVVPKNITYNYVLGYRVYQHEASWASLNDGEIIPEFQDQGFSGGGGEFSRRGVPLGYWLRNSLQVHMSAWEGNRVDGSPMLDTTPGSPAERLDGGITVGRTYSDLEADVHITVLSVNDTEPQSMDVVVHTDTAATNTAPSIVLRTDRPISETGQILVDMPQGARLSDVTTFVAEAVDPDGDELVYSWDFGDGMNVSQNTSEIDYSWFGKVYQRLIPKQMVLTKATSVVACTP